jgi:hypothetical protein
MAGYLFEGQIWVGACPLTLHVVGHPTRPNRGDPTAFLPRTI